MVNSPHIIGISGKQFAGKDELAQWLLTKLPTAVQRPIAGAIKVAYAQQHGLTLTELETHKAEHRPGLIALGNWGRTQDANYWLTQVLAAAQAEPGIITIVSDVRLPHEADQLREAGAVLIRVNTDRAIRSQRGQLVSETDPTECGLDDYADWDAVLFNNGSREAFFDAAEPLLTLIHRRFGLE